MTDHSNGPDASDVPGPDAVTESITVRFETVKHQTTLSAGSIVVIGTFLKDIFSFSGGTIDAGKGNYGVIILILIVLSFVGFGVSLATSTFALSYFPRLLRLHIENPGTDIDRLREANDAEYRWTAAMRNRAISWGNPVSSSTLLLGQLCFGAAVVMNLWPR
jgi:hypothetical protein